MSAVPKLRFPEFDGRWEHSKIGKFLSWHKQKTKVENEFPVMSSSRAGLVLQSEYYGENRITLRSNIGFNVIPPNYVTFRNRSDDRKFFFNTNRTGTSGAISQFYPVFDVVNADKDFLVLLLNLKQHELGILSVGTSQTVLSNTELTNAKFAFPSLPEQQKIASFLSSVDNKIDLLRQKKDALELYKKGLMQRIFSQEISFKKDDGSDFPDWEEVALGDVFTERSERGHGDKQLLGVTLSKGVVRASEIEKIDRSSSDLSSYKYVMVGDIAYNSMRMWQGASGASNYNGIVSPAYTVITPLGDNETKFWAYLFRYPEMIKIFERHSQGLTSDTWNLKFKALSTIKVLRPSGKEQKKISSYFTSIDAKVEKLSSQTEQMQTFKKGLLQQMFV